MEIIDNQAPRSKYTYLVFTAFCVGNLKFCLVCRRFVDASAFFVASSVAAACFEKIVPSLCLELMVGDHLGAVELLYSSDSVPVLPPRPLLLSPMPIRPVYKHTLV